MKHPTRNPSPSDEVVTIGTTPYDQLWAEAVASNSASQYSESDGWLTAKQFAKRVGIDIKTARFRLEAYVEDGVFEKVVGVNQSHIPTNYYRPMIKKPEKRKNGPRK